MKNLKSKGYENCSAEHKTILVKIFFFFYKIPFTITVFHILNRKLPQGTKVWPPGSLDINPFDYLKCGVSRRGINRPSHTKKTVPDPTIMEVFINIPREVTKRACSPFRPRLEKVVAVKGVFIH